MKLIKKFESFTKPYGNIMHAFTEEEFEDVHDIFISEVGDSNNMAHMLLSEDPDDGNNEYVYDPIRSNNQYVIRHWRNIVINIITNNKSSYLKIKDDAENKFKKELLKFGFIFEKMPDYTGYTKDIPAITGGGIGVDVKYYINISIIRHLPVRLPDEHRKYNENLESGNHYTEVGSDEYVHNAGISLVDVNECVLDQNEINIIKSFFELSSYQNDPSRKYEFDIRETNVIALTPVTIFFRIFKCKDEWWYIKRSIMNRNTKIRAEKYFKCDQWEGLLYFLKNEIE